MSPSPGTRSRAFADGPGVARHDRGDVRWRLRRRLLGALLVLAVGSIPSATARQEVADGPASPGALTRDAQLARHPGPEMSRLAERARELLDGARAAAGLAPLAGDAGLAILARRHALELARRNRVTHHSEVFGLTTERRVRISYPRLDRFAENVARNGTVEALHAALLRSPRHRQNRLDPDFTHVGLGVARGSPHMLYLVEVFAESPDGRPLEIPATVYFDAPPDAYERREAPRSEFVGESLTVGPPGEDDPEYWTHRGIDAFLAGELQAARTWFRRALDLKHDYHYARYNLARVLLRLDRPAAAARELDLLLDERPDDVEARYARGTAALLDAEYDRAETEFRRVIERRRQDAGAWYNLGLALEYQERPDEAVGAYLTALDLDPGMQEAHRGLHRLGREAPARR